MLPIQSQIISTSGNWKAVGDTNLSIITSDADNGDGVGDGAINVDGQSAVVGQGASYTFGGTMTQGESITIDTYTYNPSSSYVTFYVQLYNVSSSTALTTSSSITYNNSASPPVLTTLNYTATASDDGDTLELRYIRSDNGHTARNFAIDNVSLNGTYLSLSLAQTCPFTVNPDLPLIASNATIESEIITAVSKFSDSYLGTIAPSAGQLSSAESAYDAFNISVSDGEISGNSISSFKTASFLKTFAKHLKFNPDDTNIQTKVNNTVWWFSKQFCSGALALDVQLYGYEDFARPTSLLQDFLDPGVKDFFAYTLYKHSEDFGHYWEPTYDASYQENNNTINTDLMYNISDVMLAYSLWHNTADERYRYMRAYKRFVDRFFSYTVGTTDGIKVDGTGFHHWVSYTDYMYAFNTTASLMTYLSGTSFQIERANYEVFRNAFYTQYMHANDTGVQAFSTSGRNPQSRTRPLSQSSLKKIAIAGGEVLGLSTADPVFAGMYNRIYGVDAAFNYSIVAPFEAGFFQFNHAQAGAFRKNDWVVFNKGFSSYSWGSEIYIPQNRYGRYQSYGAQEVIYPGNKETGNGYDHNTWDWNFNPGTTVIKLPWEKLHAERGRLDEHQQKRFVGALNLKNKNSELLTNNHGDYGMFAMDFQEAEGQGFSTTHTSENHNNTFTFKKSNFYLDDIIVCLGSGISNDDTSNPTITTLYQRLDNKGTSPSVNGASQSSSGEVNFTGTSDNWLLSNYNTGFYLLSGNDNLVVKKELQQTPNQNQIWPVNFSSNPTDTYYTGYIDHGTNPSNKSYEYILMPDSNINEMQTLNADIQGGNKPYTVHQQDATAHIVEHKSKDVWGYSFFNVASNLSYNKVTGASASCLVMTDRNPGTLLLSVVNPDIGFNSKEFTPSVEVTRQITLQGEWALSDSYPGVQIVTASVIQTIIEFTLVDGLAKEVLLEEITFVNPDYPIVYYEDFRYDTGNNGFTKHVINDGGHTNASSILNRVSDIPDLLDSNGAFIPETDRPANRIPQGSANDQKAISISGNDGSTNFGIDAYAAFTTLDLTDSNPLINDIDTYKYASFWTQRRYGDGDIATITMQVSTAFTGDPATTIWTTIPLYSGKLAETADGLTYVKGIVDLTPYADGENGSTVTLALHYQGSDSNHSSTNRNGTFYFSDLQFYVQSVALPNNSDVCDNDTEAPIIECPSDIILDNDAGACGAIASFEATASDNCEGAEVTYSPASGSLFAVGTTEVTATATDASGNETSCTFNVTVNDTEAPTIVCPSDIILDNDPGVCGAIASFEATASDNCEGTEVTYSLVSGSFFAVGTTEVTVIATDASGNESSCAFNVTVNDTIAPEISCPSDTTIECDEDVSPYNTGTATVTDDCDDYPTMAYEDTIVATGTCSNSYTIERIFTATDAHGNSSSCTQNITVQDTQGPSDIVIDAPLDPIRIGTAFNLSATYNDCNAVSATFALSSNDVDYITFNADVLNGTVSLPNSVTQSLEAGVYKVVVTITDECNNTNQEEFTYLVIFDPNGGFVTGGGNFFSNPGAYRPDLTKLGKVNFGFVAKYDPDDNTLYQVKGSTRFNFKEEDFSFKSTSHQAMTLVVTGEKKATYRGIGTVNNSGSHQFVVVVIDGDAPGGNGIDRFRIKVFASGNSNEVIYDNEYGLAENADVSTTLGGGSIVIHKEKGKSSKSSKVKLVEEAPIEIISEIKLVSWPNPSNSDFNLKLKSNNNIDNIQIQVIDVNGRYVYNMSGKANQEYRFGASFESGLYFVNVIQGNESRQVKLVKY
jgi:hypothetical protein